MQPSWWSAGLGLVALLVLLAACERQASEPVTTAQVAVPPPPPSEPTAAAITSPRTVAIESLEAYKAKDVPRLLGLSSAATRALGPQLQPGDPTYEGLFGASSWRMRNVEAVPANVEECRIRDEEAQCVFRTLPKGAVVVVALKREEGEWRFTDLLSPTRAQYEAWGTPAPR